MSTIGRSNTDGRDVRSVRGLKTPRTRTNICPPGSPNTNRTRPNNPNMQNGGETCIFATPTSANCFPALTRESRSVAVHVVSEGAGPTLWSGVKFLTSLAAVSWLTPTTSAISRALYPSSVRFLTASRLLDCSSSVVPSVRDNPAGHWHRQWHIVCHFLAHFVPGHARR